MLSLRGRRFGLGPLIAARGGPRRYARATTMALAAAVTASTWSGDRGALAVPIDDPHIGGIGFSGPTTGDLAAIYWNPAALGLIRGINLTFAGTGDATWRALRSIEPETSDGLAFGTFGPLTAPPSLAAGSRRLRRGQRRCRW